MMCTNAISRRGFMARLLAGAAAPIMCAGRTEAAVGVHPRAIAVVGCGNRGARCVEAWTQLPAAAPPIVAVCDSQASRGRHWARRVNADYVSDWRDCIDADVVDGIIIATPDGIAQQLCAHAVAADKAVFWDCSTTLAPQALLRGLSETGAANAHLFSPMTSMAHAASAFLATGVVGAPYLGHAAAGRHARIADMHMLLAWFLVEALYTGDAWRAHTIGDASGKGLTTAIRFEHGPRLEITSGADASATHGTCIRAQSGTLRLLGRALTVASEHDQGRRLLPVEAQPARMEAFRAWLGRHPSRGSALLMRHIANDIERLTRQDPYSA